MGKVTRKGIGGEQREPVEPREEMTPEEIVDLRDAAEEFAAVSYAAGQDYGLSAEALRYLYVATQTMETSPRKVAEMAGVDFKVWYRWRGRKEFRDALEAIYGAALTDMTLDMIRAIRKATRDDDAKIALAGGRTIAELQGRFVQRVETTRVTESAEERAFRRNMAKRQGETSDANHSKLN